MKKAIFSICLILASIYSFTQITFTNRPQNFQLYPRNTSTNLASVPVSGTVTGSGYSRIRLQVFRNNILQSAFEQAAPQNSTFSFSYLILAELVNYKFVVELENPANTWNHVYTADNVVAGDAIIIQGQSNAGASQNWSGEPVTPSYNSPFIRVLGSASPNLNASGVNNLTWALGDPNAGPEGTLPNTGQWGYVMARLILNQSLIPIAIFNGAHGGKGIEFFRRNAANPGNLSTNYGRLFARVQKGGFLNSIRAIFWFQGESDADLAWDPDETLTSYKAKWNEIYNGWKTDFPTTSQRYYITQIRNGCNGEFERTKFLNEALRQLTLEHNSDTRIYGSGALMQEPAGAGDPLNQFCHYTFTNGYEKLGIDWSRVVLKDLYNVTLPESTLSPFVISINKPGPTQITLTLAHSDPLTITPGALGNFKFEGASTQPVISASVSANTITLNLNVFPSGTTGLSYNDQVNHRGDDDPDIVTTSNKLALVNFTNVAIILGAFPVKLINFGGVPTNSDAIDLNWTVSDESMMSGYEILHGNNGTVFNIIGFLPANNLQLQHQYNFRHQGAGTAANYYRLKMIATNGTYTYSPVINIKGQNQIKEFTISVNPNPVFTQVQLYIHSPKTEKAEISIVNQFGQLISSYSKKIETGSNVILIPGYNFHQSGVYFVKVKMNNTIKTSKFLFISK